ncbi:MAG TPA: alpha/beta hydrolase [Bacillota bacterium]|nr:alpha/beta hydrolase [Bacillota bacterium]
MTFVLVHGAWGGGWGWTPFAEAMRRRGHQVFTPTLTGMGERSHLFSGAINLSTHIEDICNVIRYERLRDFVLAGHSYGGMVVTGVADRMADRIRSLVYIDAFLPEDGRALIDYTPGGVAAQLMDAGSRHGGLAVSVPSPWVLPGLSPAEQAEIEALRGPQPLGTLVEKIRLSGAGERIPRRMYILASENPGATFRRFYDGVRGRPGWEMAEVACGHGIHRERPEELIPLLERMA